MTGYRKSFWLPLIFMLSAFLGGGMLLSGLCADEGSPEQSLSAAVVIPPDTASGSDSGNMSETSCQHERAALDPFRLGRLFRLTVSQDNGGRSGRFFVRMLNCADIADTSAVADSSGVCALGGRSNYAFFCEYIAGLLPVRAGPFC